MLICLLLIWRSCCFWLAKCLTSPLPEAAFEFQTKTFNIPAVRLTFRKKRPKPRKCKTLTGSFAGGTWHTTRKASKMACFCRNKPFISRSAWQLGAAEKETRQKRKIPKLHCRSTSKSRFLLLNWGKPKIAIFCGSRSTQTQVYIYIYTHFYISVYVQKVLTWIRHQSRSFTWIRTRLLLQIRDVWPTHLFLQCFRLLVGGIRTFVYWLFAAIRPTFQDSELAVWRPFSQDV